MLCPNMSEDAWMADTEELGTEKRQCVSVGGRDAVW